MAVNEFSFLFSVYSFQTNSERIIQMPKRPLKYKYILINSKRWNTKFLIERKGDGNWVAKCDSTPGFLAQDKSYPEIVRTLTNSLKVI